MTRPHLSYANVVSTLALALVLTGGGVAVATGALEKNSVGSAQIKNGQVRAPDLAARAVTGGKVKDNSLTGADIRERTLDLPVNRQVVTVATPFDANPREVPAEDAPNTQVGSVTIEAPADGVVVVTAGVEFASDAAVNGFIAGQIVPDRAEIAPVVFDFDAGDGDGPFDQRQGIAAAFEVSGGEHTFVLSLEQIGASDPALYYGLQLIAQWTEGEIAG